MPIMIAITLVTSMLYIMYIPTPDSPVLASLFQVGILKILHASKTLKWPYLGRINSGFGDSSCIGFPAGPTIMRKLRSIGFLIASMYVNTTIDAIFQQMLEPA